ncbi:MAG: hypothetical protein HY043_01250 [Verrucomicrobia bacterium]|nr:hypothetical protein [Verrucomicrobiota bacterium]
MSNYVLGTSLSYRDYLQSKSFVDDLREDSCSLRYEVSRQTCDIIASAEQLHANKIEVLEGVQRSVSQTNNLILVVTSRLDDISDGLSEVNSTLHWGFTQLLGQAGRMNDSLDSLIQIAKTPAQTWAYEQHEIARDAMRRDLYPEALDSLARAIDGYGGQPGYKLEFRFHFSRGTILLGGVSNCDPAVMNLAEAEQAFLTAARYAKADFRAEAARAYLSAGWAAYCQGKMAEAQSHTQQATELNPKLGEAFFQLAKIKMHIDQPDAALPDLKKAIELDRDYSLKAAADGDFKRHEAKVISLLEDLREAAHQAARAIKATAQERFKAMVAWHADESAKNEYEQALHLFAKAKQCFESGTFFGYLDAVPFFSSFIPKVDEALRLQEAWLNSEHDQLVRVANSILELKRQSVWMPEVVEVDHAPKELRTVQEKCRQAISQLTNRKSYAEFELDRERLRDATTAFYKVRELARGRCEAAQNRSAKNKRILISVLWGVSFCLVGFVIIALLYGLAASVFLIFGVSKNKFMSYAEPIATVVWAVITVCGFWEGWNSEK